MKKSRYWGTQVVGILVEKKMSVPLYFTDQVVVLPGHAG